MTCGAITAFSPRCAAVMVLNGTSAGSHRPPWVRLTRTDARHPAHNASFRAPPGHGRVSQRAHGPQPMLGMDRGRIVEDRGAWQRPVDAFGRRAPGQLAPGNHVRVVGRPWVGSGQTIAFRPAARSGTGACGWSARRSRRPAAPAIRWCDSRACAIAFSHALKVSPRRSGSASARVPSR